MYSRFSAKIHWKFFNCKFLEEGIGLIKLGLGIHLICGQKAGLNNFFFLTEILEAKTANSMRKEVCKWKRDSGYHWDTRYI